MKGYCNTLTPISGDVKWQNHFGKWLAVRLPQHTILLLGLHPGKMKHIHCRERFHGAVASGLNSGMRAPRFLTTFCLKSVILTWVLPEGISEPLQKSSLERTCQTRRFHGWESLRQMFFQTIPERRFWRREIGLLKMISAWQYKEASVKPPAFSPLEAELPTAESLKFILGWPFFLRLTRPKQNTNSSHKNPTCQCLRMLLVNARIWKQLKHLWIGEWVNKSMCVLNKNKWLRMSIDTHNMDPKCTSLRGGVNGSKGGSLPGYHTLNGLPRLVCTSRPQKSSCEGLRMWVVKREDWHTVGQQEEITEVPK